LHLLLYVLNRIIINLLVYLLPTVALRKVHLAHPFVVSLCAQCYFVILSTARVIALVTSRAAVSLVSMPTQRGGQDEEQYQ
jgi:hypothetical protein